MAKRKKSAQRNRVRRFTPEYKAEAVRLLRESGRPYKEVAEDLGISAGSLYRWNQELRGSPRETVDIELSPEEEVKRLRKRVRELEMEREILKKAAAFFAKESE